MRATFVTLFLAAGVVPSLATRLTNRRSQKGDELSTPWDRYNVSEECAIGFNTTGREDLGVCLNGVFAWNREIGWIFQVSTGHYIVPRIWREHLYGAHLVGTAINFGDYLLEPSSIGEDYLEFEMDQEQLKGVIYKVPWIYGDAVVVQSSKRGEQCGGTGWTGPVLCATYSSNANGVWVTDLPSTCKKLSDDYSVCQAQFSRRGEQCGGTGWTGPVLCAAYERVTYVTAERRVNYVIVNASSHCNKLSDNYSECQAEVLQMRGEQCGGTGWTGPVHCEYPSTCKKLSDNYSECQVPKCSCTA